MTAAERSDLYGRAERLLADGFLDIVGAIEWIEEQVREAREERGE